MLEMVKIPLGWGLVSCVPEKSLGCSGSMLPMLPTFFNSDSILHEIKQTDSTKVLNYRKMQFPKFANIVKSGLYFPGDGREKVDCSMF